MQKLAHLLPLTVTTTIYVVSLLLLPTAVPWLPRPVNAGDNNYSQPLVNYTCSNATVVSPKPSFPLSTLLQNLSSQASTESFHYQQSADGSVYASYLCRGDISRNHALCHDCVAKAGRSIVDKCTERAEGGVIWYEQCMLRFSSAPFLGRLDLSSPRFNCNVYDINDEDVSGFDARLRTTLKELSVEAAESKFGTREFEFTLFMEVYSLEECTPDLSAEDCGRCLEEGMGLLLGRRCVGKQGGRVLFPSCNIRYETYRFYKVSTVHKRMRISGRGMIGISVAVAVLICCGVGFLLYKRRMAHQPSAEAGMDEITTSVRSLQFELSMLKATTRNFSSDNMLGSGGFGSVYKGKLENGQEVAIKRLSVNSAQGIDEFKTEVALLAKLQHRNLVKLLGFCLSRKEKILVYEFLPNYSLDKFLLDPTKGASLDWATRYKIVVGIAKGLLYLHQDSRLTIIHRDLKSSNILLDETLNPKISDFGLARLLGVDQTQAGTNRIVGTYGYMAPEYAMTGSFSVKSDVYSFGIIVLELVSGQVNRFFNRPQFEEALLLRACRVWEEETPMELVDPCLGKSYMIEEATTCIHIALLCIQGDAARRPDMAMVVALLNGQSTELPPVPPNGTLTPNFCLSGQFWNVDDTKQVDKEEYPEPDQTVYV